MSPSFVFEDAPNCVAANAKHDTYAFLRYPAILQRHNAAHLVFGKLGKWAVYAALQSLWILTRPIIITRGVLTFFNRVLGVVFCGSEKQMRAAQLVITVRAIVTDIQHARLFPSAKKVGDAMRAMIESLYGERAISAVEAPSRPEFASVFVRGRDLRPKPRCLFWCQIGYGTIAYSHDAFSVSESGLVRLVQGVTTLFGPLAL